MMARTFWMLLSWICVLWYSTLTVYVAVKGTFDVKRMLAQLRGRQGDEKRGKPVRPSSDPA